MSFWGIFWWHQTGFNFQLWEGNTDVYKPDAFLSTVPNTEQKVVNGFSQLMAQKVLHADASFFSISSISHLTQETKFLFLSHGTVFVSFFIHACE